MHPALLASTHFLLLQLTVAILSLPLFSAVGSMMNHAAAMSYSVQLSSLGQLPVQSDIPECSLNILGYVE